MADPCAVGRSVVVGPGQAVPDQWSTCERIPVTGVDRATADTLGQAWRERRSVVIELTAGLGLDTPVQEWAQVNVTARLLAHQKTLPSNLNVDLQFLTAKDVTTADTSKGWTGYPNVATRFKVLWPRAK